MIQHMEELAANAGHRALYLGVNPIDNPRAHALYLRLGYEPLGEPRLDRWQFTDSSGTHHEGEEPMVDMAKPLR